MVIRQAKGKDLKSILNLFELTIRSTCSSDYSQEQIDIWTASIHNIDKWNQRIEKQYFIVSEIDNVLAGFSSLHKHEYIDLLYVSKDYLRRGIASKLLSELEKKAINANCKLIATDSSITAKPFFEKKGFYTIRKNELIISNIALSNFRMEKLLK